MSLCPVCGRVMCDHPPNERGQTFEEMMRPLSVEEKDVLKGKSNDSSIEVAKRHAHDPVK